MFSRGGEGRTREPLRVSRVMARGGCRLILEGVIDEQADLAKHLAGLSGQVVLDLDKVTRITSFGVLEWRSALKQLETAGYYAFIRCRPGLLTQFNLVVGFAERGDLVSFYLPYICSGCSHEFELLVDLRHHYDVAVSREPPYALCRKCGAEAQLDGLADDFLFYVGSRPRPHVPSSVLPLIDGIVGDVVKSLKVRKEIDGLVTAVGLTGPLNAAARLSGPMDGIEGFLLIDLRDLTSLDQAGMDKLATAIGQLSVLQCCYARLPLPFFVTFSAHLKRRDANEGLCSVLVHEQCPRCLINGDFELTGRDIGDEDVRARCGNCRSEVRLRPPVASLRQLRESLVEAAPEIAAYLSGHQPAAAPGDVSPATPAEAEAAKPAIVGESPPFREIMETLRKVAPTSTAVLLRGETGTGKEMLARLVHALSPRRDGPFVAINCAALPENLIETELFGHERGAFTGATQQKHGRFELANGGTLFIDEVGDIPPSVQVKLLRALQEKYIERVGSSAPIAIDIRLIAATHRSLEQMIDSGLFREDLYFRISVVPVFIPPLRQRKADIWPIALHYLGEAQQRSGRTGIRFSEQMRSALEAHSWPGNVRELINVVERAVALTSPHGTADLVEFGRPEVRSRSSDQPTAPQPILTQLPAAGLKAAVDEYEKKLIQDALARSNGNRTHAARELNISRQALVLKIAKYSLG